MTKIFLVRVKFSSSEQILVNHLTNEIDISIKEVPIKGRANKAIINILSKYYNIKTENIKIVRGLFSKTKFIEIS
jgi:uncharacterized protein YggU (UPF0235/DUF167 family)